MGRQPGDPRGRHPLAAGRLRPPAHPAPPGPAGRPVGVTAGRTDRCAAHRPHLQRPVPGAAGVAGAVAAGVGAGHRRPALGRRSHARLRPLSGPAPVRGRVPSGADAAPGRGGSPPPAAPDPGRAGRRRHRPAGPARAVADGGGRARGAPRPAGAGPACADGRQPVLPDAGAEVGAGHLAGHVARHGALAGRRPAVLAARADRHAGLFARRSGTRRLAGPAPRGDGGHDRAARRAGLQRPGAAAGEAALVVVSPRPGTSGDRVDPATAQALADSPQAAGPSEGPAGRHPASGAAGASGAPRGRGGPAGRGDGPGAARRRRVGGRGCLPFDSRWRPVARPSA